MAVDFEGKIRELHGEIERIRSHHSVDQDSFERKRQELLSKKEDKLIPDIEHIYIHSDLHFTGNRGYYLMILRGRENTPKSEQTVTLSAWPFVLPEPIGSLPHSPFTLEEFNHRSSESFDLDEFLIKNPSSLTSLLSREKYVMVTADGHFQHIKPVDPETQNELEEKLKSALMNIELENIIIDKKNQRISQEIGKISEEYSQRKREFEVEIGRRDHQINYLQNARRILSSSPVIKKYSAVLDDRPFYSMWMETSPVFLYADGRLLYLHTARKDKPLQLVSASLDEVVGPENTKLAQILLGLEEDKFCTDQGYVLEGEAERFAADRFEQVMTGVEILPSEDSPDGYRVIQRRDGRENPDQPRHWGQVHLVQLRPDNIVTGELLGSGGSYKAYVFGDKTVVEFDQENRATYLFDTGYFENLRVWKRSRILSDSPPGFEGRIIHSANKDLWREQVSDFLR